MESNLPVKCNSSIVKHGLLESLHHQSDGLFNISRQLAEIQELRQSWGDIFSLCHKNEYTNLAKDVIYNNIRAGGYLPYRCFVILVLELAFCGGKHLTNCLNRLKNDVSTCPQSRNLLTHLEGYTKFLSSYFSPKEDVQKGEMALFSATSFFFDDAKTLSERLLNRYRMRTRTVVGSHKLLMGNANTESYPAKYDPALWTDKYTLVANLSLTIWALSLSLRLNEIDLAVDLLKYIPQRANNFKVVCYIRSVVLAEKGREVYKTDGPTKEAYDYMLESLSNCYSWDVVVDISNCLIENFDADVFSLFRPGGKYYGSLDLHGKVCMSSLLPLDEKICKLEGLIEQSIKEKNNRVVHELAIAYFDSGLEDKADVFIKKMETIEWDEESSGKADHILIAKFQIAKDYEDVISIGEQLLSTYRKKRITFLAGTYRRLAEAYFEVGRIDMAKMYCNKGLTYEGSDDYLWKLKERIDKKEKTN